MEKTTKLYALVHGKCPHCRRGDIFTGTLYGFNLQRTNAMNVMEMIAVGIATYIFSGGNLEFDSLWLYVGVIFSGCFILAPFNYRYSRVILLHWLSPKISYNAYYDQP